MPDRIEITILGCGSSGGVPRIGNDWGACDPQNPKNRRLRCSILVERFGAEGTTTVLIDTGPDLRQQLLSANIGDVDAVLYTHAHADHLHGIDDLRMIAIRHKKHVPVFMDETTYERATAAFDYCFRTPEGSSYPPIMERHAMTAGEPVEITGAGGALTFLPVEVVHGEINALGFRFHGAGYLPDVSDIPARAIAPLSGLDVLILDCLRRTPHPSHFHLDATLTWQNRLAPGHCITTNMHNDLDYDTLARELPTSVEPAFDGMKLTLPTG
ncbi:MBL fold metallo-hydrolase [Roseibium sp.]|uniref:MBL fold metallo-hydrolase n=1 Tax=Roseibium sp. TaxID=1936156 RepID=UPI003A96E15C